MPDFWQNYQFKKILFSDFLENQINNVSNLIQHINKLNPSFVGLQQLLQFLSALA